MVGPTVRDGAIVYDEISSSADLPVGWTDEQDGGHYRLRRRDDDALFGYAVGPHSWKRYQLPPHVRLWRARRDEDGELGATSTSRRAGRPATPSSARARASCTPMGILDRVLLGGAHPDPADARAARGRLRRRRAVRAGRRHVLLRLDGHRADRRERASTSR